MVTVNPISETRPALKCARTKCIMQKELLSFDMHPLAPPPSRPERITRGAKFRRMFPVRFTKNKVGSCQVPVGDTTVSNCHAAEREVRRETAGYISSRRHASKCRSLPCFKQATPPFTGVSNHYLAVHHLHYRILIILDIDSIPLSFPLFSLLRFVKFSNEQFYRIWLYRDYYWLFLILSDCFNTWICTFEYGSNMCCDVDGILDSFLIHFSTYYYYKVWWVKFRCE